MARARLALLLLAAGAADAGILGRLNPLRLVGVGREEPYLVAFEGASVKECQEMRPVLKKLERKLGTRVLLYDVWADPASCRSRVAEARLEGTLVPRRASGLRLVELSAASVERARPRPREGTRGRDRKGPMQRRAENGRYKLMQFLEKDAGGKSMCGGLPFYYHRRTGAIICGATTLANLEAWARGEPHQVLLTPPPSAAQKKINARVLGRAGTRSSLRPLCCHSSTRVAGKYLVSASSYGHSSTRVAGKPPALREIQKTNR